ncbi:alanine racemase [Caldalkalibacillus mannanilyticus]|uniref:alanine racemase n=1 Tax=Caldalkalibacillus mannanilyticus TaxID=1418 RepID=UPI00046852E1|nr:alanine racemase [Caldalkalibacillus mannanilyticus]
MFSPISSELPKAWLTPSIKNRLLTPQVLIHYQQLEANIKRMEDFAQRYQLKLRPHLKTHKTAEIAALQLKHGACGLTVAKISEAEALVASPVFKNQKLSILIAYPIVGEQNFQRVLALAKQATLLLMIDSVEQAKELHHFAEKNQTTFSVLIKIDTGLKRCGIQADTGTLQSFLQQVLPLKNILIHGLMTHAGHAYGASTTEKRKEIATYEGEALVRLKHDAQQHSGINLADVSVGSTPTVYLSGTIPGVTEIRPGNYVFYDRTQVSLGSATWQDCSLRVLSRVVSHPAPQRWIIDAGSKTLALDQGAHGQAGVAGYGYIVDQPHLQIARLSEEHGVVEGNPTTPLCIGDIIEIIPNHSCPVANLANQLLVLKKEDRDEPEFETWNVMARGRNY